MSTQSTQRMVFNDNYWGPPRERLPELRLRTSTQTNASPLTYSHTIGRGEQTGQGFRYPVALAVNPRTGLMYVANRSYEYRIELKRISICTVDEHFVGQFSTGGVGDGQIFWPRGLAIDKEDKVYLSDEWLQRISIWTGDGDYLGKWGTQGSGDGEINRPAGIAFDSQDNLFVVDGSNHRIQKFTKDGRFLAKWGSFGSSDGQFNFPWGIEIDSHDHVYVADWRNDRIQKFSPEGDFLLKFGSSGSGDGQFNRPSDVAVDKDGDIYVTDWDNDRLQMFDAGGNHIYTFLGEGFLAKWGSFGSGDGQFNFPWGIEIDANDHVYVADWRNDRIQKFSPEGDFLMQFGSSGSGDGQFNRPSDVAVDQDGDIYVTDWGNDRLQMFDAGGNHRYTFLGEGTLSKWGIAKLDANNYMWNERQVAWGLERVKYFEHPIAVDIDPEGRILVLEPYRTRIQVYTKNR